VVAAETLGPIDTRVPSAAHIGCRWTCLPAQRWPRWWPTGCWSGRAWTSRSSNSPPATAYLLVPGALCWPPRPGPAAAL